MILTIYTLVHVVISLVAIVSGFIVLSGLFSAKRLDGATAIFLIFTAATDVTGFFFPFHGFKPSYVLAIISLLVLALAYYARYTRNMAGHWRVGYVITAVVSLYLNIFVLVAQCFMKIPALNALAPTGSEPTFLITELVVMAIFVLLTILAAKRFRIPV